RWIADRANALLAGGLHDVNRVPYQRALKVPTTHRHDYVSAYVNDLGSVIDMDAIRGAKLKLGVDPLGGAGVAYWPRIAERYGFALDVLNRTVDPTFRFMTADWDGKIRMGLRYGSRSARHRDSQRGPDEPESLSRGGYFISFPQPCRMAGGCRRRQDAGEQQPYRSCCCESRAETCRSSCRLQMVRRWPARWLAG